jgi:DnaJ-class molecular chaperone
MSDETKSIRRLELLVESLMAHLNIEKWAERCQKCDGSGKWQDGGDCAICNGAGEVFGFKGNPCNCACDAGGCA